MDCRACRPDNATSIKKAVLIVFRPLTGKQYKCNPLRPLRLCGEQIAFVENPVTYLTAQFEIFWFDMKALSDRLKRKLNKTAGWLDDLE